MTYAKTGTGNRIDERLAMGYAKAAMRDVTERSAKFRGPWKIPLKISNAKARQRSAEKFAKFLGNTLIRCAATPQFETFACAYMRAYRREETTMGLLVRTAHVSCGAPENDLRRRDAEDYTVDVEVVAVVPYHLFQRLAQRKSIRTLDGFMAEMNTVLGWASIANDLDVMGDFVVPTADGLFCCSREVLRDELTEEGAPAVVTLIKTWYPVDTMRLARRDSYAHMVDLGIDLHRPKLPRLRPASEAEKAMMAVMMQEAKPSLDMEAGRQAREHEPERATQDHYRETDKEMGMPAF